MEKPKRGGARKGAGAKIQSPDGGKRKNVISFKVSDVELMQIDKNRGDTPRAEWIRKIITNK